MAWSFGGGGSNFLPNSYYRKRNATINILIKNIFLSVTVFFLGGVK